MTPDRIIVAVDVDNIEQAHAIAKDLQGTGVSLKIGNQLGTYEGWRAAVELGKTYDSPVFCDTKFKDIPKTVELSARAITRFQPAMFNIMADNSLTALEAAVRGVTTAMQDYQLDHKPLLLGVTVLTSISDEESVELYGAPAAEKVQQFAKNAAIAGLDGLVCSAQEIKQLKVDPATKHLILVTPGIRPTWAEKGDQSRVMTPKMAKEAGADYLVIGRPITQPPDSIGSPRDAVAKIMEELQ